MSTNTTKAWFDLHSASGVVLGLAMFVVSFSGVVALFADYLPSWELSSFRASGQALDFDPDRMLAQLESGAPEVWQQLPLSQPPPAAEPDNPGSPVFLFAPTPHLPLAHVRWFDTQEGVAYDYFIEPTTGTVVAEPELALRDTLVGFHTDLLLPRPFGRYLVGFLGVGFLFVVITGIVFHRKFLRQMFLFRRGKKLRYLWADSHKLFGAWGLLFHLMITFTGAFLGLIGVFLLVSALTVYRGDQDAAFAAVVPPTAEPSGDVAPMLPLGELLERAKTEWPELEADMLSLYAYNDRNAEVIVGGAVQGNLVGAGPTGTQVTLSAVTGEVVRVTNWADGSLWQRLVGWVVPLHYATYGGFLLKLAYCLLGLSSALMSVTGLLVWLERRAPKNAAARYRWLERLTLGVSLGLPVAVAALFAATPLLPGTTIDQHVTLQWVFWIVWLSTILYAYRPKNPRTATGWLTAMLGGLAFLAAVLDLVLNPQVGGAPWSPGSALGVHLALLATAIVSLLVAKRLLFHRPETRQDSPAVSVQPGPTTPSTAG